VKNAGKKSQSEPPAAIQKDKAHTLKKRTKVDVDEGKTRSGADADELRTWSVTNCISIAGYDTSSGEKAMAHINAVTTGGVEYAEQFGTFANIVYSSKRHEEVEIWITVDGLIRMLFPQA
jgi:hypothetical protein